MLHSKRQRTSDAQQQGKTVQRPRLSTRTEVHHMQRSCDADEHGLLQAPDPQAALQALPAARAGRLTRTLSLCVACTSPLSEGLAGLCMGRNTQQHSTHLGTHGLIGL
jgi:hypothetical protein